jgi:uncharacterized protein
MGGEKMQTEEVTLSPRKANWAIWAVLLFLLVAIVGLFYVKWSPYFAKALKAANTHDIGASMLTGKDNGAPIPSWKAAWGYAQAYYIAIWKAALLGILLGSLVQVLIPRNWLMRVLGTRAFRSTLAGGVAALPGMM